MSEVPTLIIVPGWQNSGPGHWQSLMAQQWPGAVCVQQKNWESPEKTEWVDAIAQTIMNQPGKVVVAAHSLGCIATAHLPSQVTKRIHGALLVAPAEPLRHEVLANFAPVPQALLPYRSIVVGSTNDPYCPLNVVRKYARAWGSEMVCLKNAGHINVDSGFGRWPAGENLLQSIFDEMTARDLYVYGLLAALG